MDKLSQIVSQYIPKVRFEDLGPTVIASAKRSTLDTIGAMLAGSSASGIDTVVDLAKGWGGAEEACVVGFGSRVPAPVAAWCNGAMARAREIDDCLDFLPVHPSASTVPALLALAEWKGGMSGRDFLTGLAVGQDLMIRMGLSLRRNGLQSGRNNMFRIFGSTAALAKAMGFEVAEVRNALGVAFSFAVGDGQSALDGSLTLRLQQGIAAQGAVLSMLLTSKGFTGAHDFLLGKFGYFRAFEPNPRIEYLTKDLGKSFYGDQISIKPYSACRAAHSAINLALRIRSEEHVDPRSITRVVVRTCPEVYRLAIMEVEVAGVPSVRREIDLPLGKPSYPMASGACEEKFRKCANYSVSPIEAGRLNELIEMISRLDNLPDVSVLSPWLAGIEGQEGARKGATGRPL
ncbi:MAG: MmgE/PrpD family protein [Syntrophorhabdales bacterium]|jgi:2-methylcitrate dehydratase PrpD